MYFLSSIELVLWIVFFLSTAYISFFSLVSHKKRREQCQLHEKTNRYAVIFPAYREDAVIVESVENFLAQGYPSANFTIVVVTDHMQSDTLKTLRSLPITVLEATYTQSSKAKALQLAMEHLDATGVFDGVVIMDADNHVDPTFLTEMNKRFNRGYRAIQAHRTMKNRNTQVALLDGLSEEINNTIFRKGHVTIGLSAALSGSGMLLDYGWFATHVKELSTAGEDKELELHLLREGVWIDYAESVYVYDEKTQTSDNFSNQRRRWLGAQLNTFGMACRFIPEAIKTGNIDLLNKAIQWIQIPRSLLLGITTLGMLCGLLVHPGMGMRWASLWIIQIASLLLAIPPAYRSIRIVDALGSAIHLSGLMFLNLFKLKNSSKQFIHTQHGIDLESSKKKNEYK